MATLKELKQELENVKRRSFSFGDRESFKAYKAKTEELENQINALEFKEKVKEINEREAKRRELMKAIFSIGLIDIDLLTNDMKLNKTKRKQAPELAKFVDANPYTYFSVKHSKITCINVNGFEYQTGFTTYENGKTSEPKNFESFEKALTVNNIQSANISAAKTAAKLRRIDKATAALEAAQNKYNEALKANDAYFLKCEKFASESNSHQYITTSKY
jgi:hypothetical protein